MKILGLRVSLIYRLTVSIILGDMELQATDLRFLKDDIPPPVHTHSKGSPLLSEEIDQKIMSYLESFNLPSQKVKNIWADFSNIMTKKGELYPFCVAIQDPYFIAFGLWRTYQEIESQRKAAQKPLAFKTMVSCLLASKLYHTKVPLQDNEMFCLKTLIQSNPHLTILEFFKAGITDNHLAILATILHLKELSLEENKITDKGLFVLVSHPNITKN